MKHFSKFLKIVVVTLVIIFVADAAIIFTIANWRPSVGKADAVIVLGAAINTPALINRTLTGLNLYKEGKADVMILSGGKVAKSDISEAQFMEKVITRNTADNVNYIIEDQSRTTYENIQNSKAKLDAVKVEQGKSTKTDSVIIVTDKFHLARGVLLAKRAGFKKVYWSAPEPDYYSRQDLDYYYFREFVAILDYIPKFIFG